MIWDCHATCGKMQHFRHTCFRVKTVYSAVNSYAIKASSIDLSKILYLFIYYFRWGLPATSIHCGWMFIIAGEPGKPCNLLILLTQTKYLLPKMKCLCRSTLQNGISASFSYMLTHTVPQFPNKKASGVSRAPVPAVIKAELVFYQQ